MAYYERMDEAVRYGPVCRRDIRLYSEQEQQIYKYVLENGFITTAETVEILRRLFEKRGCGTKHYLYKKYRREIMQHGYRKSNYCKRIIRKFVVKCGQIKKPPCESK